MSRQNSQSQHSWQKSHKLDNVCNELVASVCYPMAIEGGLGDRLADLNKETGQIMQSAAGSK